MIKILKTLLGSIAILMAFSFHGNAQLPKGVSLLPADSLIFKTSNASELIATTEWVNIPGQPFSKAYRITTRNRSYNDGYSLKYAIPQAVQKGDVFLLSFYSRTLSSQRETGLAFFEVGLDRLINGKYEWPPLLERGMSFGREWVLTQIPFKAAMDINAGDLAFILRCGHMPQVLEIADIKLVNYKQAIKVEELPRSTVHYDGDAADAPWRKAALERIEKLRKGDLIVKVIDAKGKPVSGASVTVSMNKNAFGWGTATTSQLILDTLDPNKQKYRDTLLRYFNKVVLENEMKARNWPRFNKAQTLKGVDWFRNKGIPVRGHVMVWPSWQHSPHLVQYQGDTAALRAAILKQINEQTTTMKGQFLEWDVVNEPYAHHNVMDALGGKKVMLEWFAAAKKNAGDTKLYLNDYTMFHAKEAGSDSFYNNLAFLMANKAPIEGIGEQAHIGGTPPSINYVLERLNKFATFGLPIQITEFDITSDDDDFKSRYMRDFLTAIYSHPSTIGFMQWGFWEPAHWMPAGALWDKDWNIRPQGTVFTELVTKTWSTNATGTTNRKGNYETRAFKGTYTVKVVNGNMLKEQVVILDSDKESVTIQLENK